MCWTQQKKNKTKQKKTWIKSVTVACVNEWSFWGRARLFAMQASHNLIRGPLCSSYIEAEDLASAHDLAHLLCFFSLWSPRRDFCCFCRWKRAGNYSLNKPAVKQQYHPIQKAQAGKWKRAIWKDHLWNRRTKHYTFWKTGFVIHSARRQEEDGMTLS